MPSLPSNGGAVFRRARREALVALALWLAALVWTLTACWLLGYRAPAHPAAGIPAWALWGIFLPWFTFFLLHAWYTLRYLSEKPRPRPPQRPGA